MSLGLVLSVIRKIQNRDSGVKIIIYVIEMAIPLSILVALGLLASQISYSPIHFWLAVSLVIAGNAFVLFRKTTNGTVVVLMWNTVKTELAGGKIGDMPKIN
jgi:hypothetical protein